MEYRHASAVRADYEPPSSRTTGQRAVTLAILVTLAIPTLVALWWVGRGILAFCMWAFT